MPSLDPNHADDIVSAIQNASSADTKAVLLSLCSESIQCERDAKTQLQDLRLKRERLENNGIQNGVAGVKRKAETELAICADCREVFSPNENKRKDCFYHPGDLEVDDEGDFWADHDENCHGIIDSDELRKEYPEGYVWTCCQNLGDEEGCTQARHSVIKKNNQAYDSAQSSDEEDDEEGEDEDEEDEE